MALSSRQVVSGGLEFQAGGFDSQAGCKQVSLMSSKQVSLIAKQGVVHVLGVACIGD